MCVKGYFQNGNNHYDALSEVKRMNIEEASVNINNQNPVVALKAAIVCTNTQDEYSAGFRNGIRFAIAILTGEEQKYEKMT